MIGTALLVVFLLSYYFFTYVPARKQQMNQRGIRAISRLDKNLHERIDHYKYTVSQFDCDYYMMNLDLIEAQIGKRIYFKVLSCSNGDDKLVGNDGAISYDSLATQLSKSLLGRVRAFRYAEKHIRDSVIEYRANNQIAINDKNEYESARQSRFEKLLDLFFEDNKSELVLLKNRLQERISMSLDRSIVAYADTIDPADAITVGKFGSRWTGTYAFLGISYEDILGKIKNDALFVDVILSVPDTSRVVNQNQLNLKYFKYIPSKENEASVLEALANGSEDEKPTASEGTNSPVHIENVDITRKTISGIDYICFTRFVEIEGKPYYLTGLVKYDDYDSNVKKISVWGVMVFVLLTLFFVLILPIAKPFLISNRERLKSTDLMWSAIALVFGISILSMLIIGVDTFIIEEKELVKDKLEQHADSLEVQFQSELEQSILASNMSENFQMSTDIKETGSEFFRNSDSLLVLFQSAASIRRTGVSEEVDRSGVSRTPSIDEIIKALKQEAVFIKALKLEFIKISNSGESGLYDIRFMADGTSIETLTNAFNRLKESVYNPEDTALLSKLDQYYNALYSTCLSFHQIKGDLDLSHRKYYQVMKDRKPSNAWSYSLRDSSKIPFYIESLFSLSSGKYSTVTVTKGNADYPDTNYSYATDYEWWSLNNRYLEPGITFAVIDKEGTIHFHSDQRKIKNQNFLEETDFNSVLSSFLHNRSRQSLGLRFSMKDHEAFVRPLDNTPWYAVIMYDIRKSRLNVTQSIITTFQILIMISLYMLLLHVVLNIDRTAGKHGHKNTFSYLFLSPINVSTRVLKMLAAFNLGQIAALAIVYAFNSINLLANITIFFSMITAGVLINYAVLTKYSLILHDSDETEASKQISGFEWVLLVFWLMWFVLAFVVSGGEGYAWFIQLLQLGIIYYYFTLKRNSSHKEFFLSESIKRPFLTRAKGGYLAFYLHSFSWIVLVGVVSTFLFFKPIYNMQHIKRGLNNWVEEFEAKNSSSFVNQRDHKINLFETKKADEPEVNGKLLKKSSAFLDYISLYFDEDEASFIGQGASIDRISVYELFDSKEGTPYFEISSKRNSYRQEVIMPRPNTMIAFDLPSIDHSKHTGLAIMFWLAIILFLWIVFYTVEALGKKFFYLDLLKRLKAVSDEVSSKQASLETLSASGLSLTNPNLMLVGPPYSGRNSIAKKLIDASVQCKYLDFFNKLNEEAKKIDDEFIRNPIIINNFDYRNLDYKLNDTKLDLLEKIIRMRNEQQVSAPLILISSFSTNQIISFYKNRVKELISKSPENKEEIDSLTSSVYRWESILFGFTTYIVKLSHKPSSDFIENELGFGSTLMHLKPQIKEFEENLMLQKGGLSDEELEDKVVEAITDMAQNYYSAIWNGCSQEEKFLLYDMSQDGLANPKNERILSNLVRKGLLLTSPALHIFNRSFALFVVENISEEDGAKMEREAKKDGIWMTYRYLVIFLVVVMIVFLAFVEKEVINKMTGIITAGGILLPRIVSFFSSFGNLKMFGKKAT